MEINGRGFASHCNSSSYRWRWTNPSLPSSSSSLPSLPSQTQNQQQSLWFPGLGRHEGEQSGGPFINALVPLNPMATGTATTSQISRGSLGRDNGRPGSPACLAFLHRSHWQRQHTAHTAPGEKQQALPKTLRSTDTQHGEESWCEKYPPPCQFTEISTTSRRRETYELNATGRRKQDSQRGRREKPQDWKTLCSSGAS